MTNERFAYVRIVQSGKDGCCMCKNVSKASRLQGGCRVALGEQEERKSSFIFITACLGLATLGLSQVGSALVRPPRAPWGPLDSGLMMMRNEVFTLLFLKGHLVLQGAPSGFWLGF